MRNLCAAVLAVAMVSTGAFAASNDAGQLLPGKPSGVKEAQAGDNAIVMVLSGVAIAGIVVALASGGGGKSAGSGSAGAVVSSSSTV